MPTGTPRAIKARIKAAEEGAQAKGAAGETDAAEAKPNGGKETPCVDELPRAEEEAQAEDAAGQADSAVAEADGGNEAVSAGEQTPGKATDQFDDLLFPNAEELGASKTGIKDAGKAGQPEEEIGRASCRERV